jgi:hypothetical protein
LEVKDMVLVRFLRASRNVSDYRTISKTYIGSPPGYVVKIVKSKDNEDRAQSINTITIFQLSLLCTI